MAIRRTIPRSQAIYPYGPGAILDSGQECFIVLDTKRAGWRHAPKVGLPRLQNRLGAPEGFRLPPVLKEGSRPTSLDVQRFPAWLFCPKCRRMWKWGREQEVQSSGAVPRCKNRSCGKSSTILVPMRYVAVCNLGHIADVDWYRWSHYGRAGANGPCDPRTAELFFAARADKGATLEALSIRCGACEAQQNLRDILNLEALSRIGQRCWGRQPWESFTEQQVRCDGKLRVLQRSQTAVHYADIVSALDLTVEVSSEPAELDRALQTMVDVLTIKSESEAEPFFPKFVEKASSTLGRSVDEHEVRAWLHRQFGGATDASEEDAAAAGYSERDLLMEEWPALTTPTVRTEQKAPLVVRREDPDAGSVPLPGIAAVYLIERLREVRAFRGFRRVRPDAEMVRPDLGANPPQRWLPAIEVFGEGVFLEFDLASVKAWEYNQERELARRLKRIIERLKSEEGYARRFAHLAPLTARFVMVHTFAHLLMRQLCYECGYGGASVRERLYVFEDRVGLLLYTAAGDSEGSLGGLVRQGRRDRLGQTITAALERGSWCSNDPICREVPEHGFEKLDLAACHACALVPETSCTHLNALLDRQLVIGDESAPVRGFFADHLHAVPAK